MSDSKEKEAPRLEVYPSKSILIQTDGSHEEFQEGEPTKAAKARLDKIKRWLEKGYLDTLIQTCRRPDASPPLLNPGDVKLLSALVDSVTSEVGRAVVGLSVLQLTIKAICPDQSIRLHKGGGRGESFSWADGIPMRVIDKYFCTPALRKYDLIHLNADGVFMTRSLAENYPYSKLYKAALRGARDEWLELVDRIEGGQLNAGAALQHLIRMLFNRSDEFQKDARACIVAVGKILPKVGDLDDAIGFMKDFIDASAYSARLFEICLHSLFQVLDDARAFEGYLNPLSQMRSANKKHGNIGDVEILKRPGSLQILEAWDAKYGKPYLREELDELGEKLLEHPETELAGFVVDKEPNLKAEICRRTKELQDTHSVDIRILGFDEWAHEQVKRVELSEKKIAVEWIVAFTESLCQLRRERAPIDEPSDIWVQELREYAIKLR